MGLKELLGVGDGPGERLVEALSRLAAAAERGTKGFLSDGPSHALTKDAQQVFYTDDTEEALDEARRFTYETLSGRKLGDWEDVPGPEDPLTGLPWEEIAKSDEGGEEDA